jgi:hypothetical protein
MKISKTFKIDESTMNEIKSLSANQNLPQGDVIDRAIALLSTQIELQKENSKKMIKIVPKITSIASDKLTSVKEGGYIILELKFGEMTFSLHSLLQVTSCNGVFGKASFIDIRESENHKTFETFDKYKDKIIEFSLSDIWDYTDKL